MGSMLWSKVGWAGNTGQQRACSHCSLATSIWARVAGPVDTAVSPRGSAMLVKDGKCSVKPDDTLKILSLIIF